MLIEKTKVLAYILHQDRLLVFRHTLFPDAGIQVPAGTVEPGEALDAAALREAREESGLDNLRLSAYLGQVDFDTRPWGKSQLHHRHFYHLELIPDTGAPPASWLHFENHPSEGGVEPIEFEFFWATYPHSVPELVAGQDALLPHLASPRRLNLLSSRLLMREFRQDDFTQLRLIHADVQVLRFRNARQVSPEKTREMLIRFEEAAHQPLSDRSEVAFALVLRETGSLVGEIGFSRLRETPGSAFLWASVNRNYWGQGLITEAARALLPLARAECGLAQLVARCRRENIPAQRSLEKIGFTVLEEKSDPEKLEYTFQFLTGEG